MSEWQTPTERAATSTSSSPISGMSSSATRATPSSWYCSAFTRRPESRGLLLAILPVCYYLACTRTLIWSPVGESSVSKPDETMSAIAICAVTTFCTGKRPLAISAMIRGQSNTG